MRVSVVLVVAVLLIGCTRERVFKRTQLDLRSVPPDEVAIVPAQPPGSIWICDIEGLDNWKRSAVKDAQRTAGWLGADCIVVHVDGGEPTSKEWLDHALKVTATGYRVRPVIWGD